MRRGRILKVRMGHEANCSSEQFAVYVLFGTGAYLLLNIILAAIQAVLQAKRLATGIQISKKHISYWIVPQVLALITLLYLSISSGAIFYGTVVIIMPMGISMVISIIVGTRLIRRNRRPILLFVILVLLPVVIIGGCSGISMLPSLLR